VQWQVLVPIRPAAVGKSRLREFSRDDAAHAELVRAIQYDALEALVTAQAMAQAMTRAQPAPEPAGLEISVIHVVSGPGLPDLPAGVELLLDRGQGLNAALRAAAAQVGATSSSAGHGLLAVVGDLPSLRPADVLAVLSEASRHRRSFVPDVSGLGTTMLAVAGLGPDGPELDPRFGPDSASRHRASGAVALDAADSARADVDTVADLARCAALGVGPRTAGVLARVQPFI
jgi:2-phospho-L-lactate guanylyltransferase